MAKPSAFSFKSTAKIQLGTAIAKFQAPQGMDFKLKGSKQHFFQTKEQCITFMSEYAEKSLEELRFEDYEENRQVPQAAKFGALLQPDLFGPVPKLQSTFYIGSRGRTQRRATRNHQRTANDKFKDSHEIELFKQETKIMQKIAKFQKMLASLEQHSSLLPLYQPSSYELNLFSGINKALLKQLDFLVLRNLLWEKVHR